MLPHEQPMVLMPHLLHRLRSNDRTESAMHVMMDPYPSERQVIVGELRPILEVQLVITITREGLIHAAELPVNVPPRTPEIARQWVLDVKIRRGARWQEAGGPLR